MVAVGVVLVVIGVLVVGEEVLRDPDEDVEADWVGCARKEEARERVRRMRIGGEEGLKRERPKNCMSNTLKRFLVIKLKFGNTVFNY